MGDTLSSMRILSLMNDFIGEFILSDSLENVSESGAGLFIDSGEKQLLMSTELCLRDGSVGAGGLQVCLAKFPSM